MRECRPKSESERNSDLEYLVKAAMLIRIREQTTWPAVPGWNQRDVTIGVIGTNPFSGIASQAFERASNEQIRYRLIQNKNLPTRYCPILFIADNKTDEVDTILKRIGSTPTLTVSDIPGFAERGGCIEFCLWENQVIKLRINEQSSLEKRLSYGGVLRDPQVASWIHKRH